MSTNIHNERIKAEYIPLYISENGSFLKKRKLPKLIEFPDIYDVQIITMICINDRFVNIGRSEERPQTKMFWSISTKTRTYASVNSCKGSF